MPHNFYYSKEYREKQRVRMIENWRRGIFDFNYKREKRNCVADKCQKVFEVQLSDPKRFCSRSCAAKFNNIKRGELPEETRRKIARALKGRESPYKGVIKVPREGRKCSNSSCGKLFSVERYRSKKFCSNQCAMNIIGRRPTSPRAARGKAGIRKDISKTTYFYSRWEANMARLFNFLGIKWIHQPRSFDIGSQRYTPDFYLHDLHIYIEVKNFMWKYSKIRDEKFRKTYPNINLILISKKEYSELEEAYSYFIKSWEYKNSPFPK